MMHPINHLF